MKPNNTLLKIGFIAGLKFTVAVMVGVIVGLILLTLTAFSADNPLNQFIIVAVVGMAAGIFFASQHLVKSGIRNAGIIAVLGAVAAVFMPLFGALIAYPALTYLLGEQRS